MMNKSDMFEVDLPEGIEVLSDYGDVQLLMNWKDLNKLNNKLIKIYNEVQTDYHAKKNDERE